MQLPLFPQRVTVRMRRRLAYSAALVRWRWEVLTGTVLKRWRDMALVFFDGRKVDGSSRGCLVQVMTVLPPTWAEPGEMLRLGMRGKAPAAR